MVKQLGLTLLETLLALACAAILLVISIKQYRQYQQNIAIVKAKNYIQDVFGAMSAFYKEQSCAPNHQKVVVLKNSACLGKNLLANNDDPNTPDHCRLFSLTEQQPHQLFSTYTAKILMVTPNGTITMSPPYPKDLNFQTYYFEITAIPQHPHQSSWLHSIFNAEKESNTINLTLTQPTSTITRITQSSNKTLNPMMSANREAFKRMTSNAHDTTTYPCAY